jgi:hypothetical protein
MAADWEKIGLPRWYDCKLGRLKDPVLAGLVGVPVGVIRYRRTLFGIKACTIDLLIEPFRHRLGVDTDARIGALCGISSVSVRKYREAQGIAPRPNRVPRTQLMPIGHPLRPYKALLGHVADSEIANLAGIEEDEAKQIREAFGYPAVEFTPDQAVSARFPDYPGPWLGYESLFGSMPSARISQAVNVPYPVIEARRLFLGAPAYVRVSRISRYAHLLGKVPNNVLAKLVGLSTARVQQLHRERLRGKGMV